MSEPPSITCPRCGKTSHHPDDVREGYCGACHDFTSRRPVSEPVGLRCPGCGQPAVPDLLFFEQAFCGNDDCHVFMWNPTKTLEENAAHASWIDLPDIGAPRRERVKRMPNATIAMPPAIQALPTNKAGYPIPWFVDRDADVDGQPDFRIMDSRKFIDAIRFQLCWVCGTRRGVHASFIVGPMCAVNRTSAEPPAHRDCAIYSALACPFLSTPKMVRRDRHMPENKSSPAGIMIPRNPGVTLVWTSCTFTHYKVDNGLLFDMGDPEAMLWFAESRPARTDEIIASIDSGLPTLRQIAEKEGDGAVVELDRRVADVRSWL